MSIHQQLLEIIEKESGQLGNWFKKQYSAHKPLFYTSVDIRDSGHKIVPVDTNIFPAGFNNLSQKTYKSASGIIDQFLESFSESKKILILQENIDRNPFYTKNIETLKRLIADTDRAVEICKTDDVSRDGERLLFGDFNPDIVILNHDLTSGVPDILANCAQPIIPSPELGWFNRRKSHHFTLYNQVVESFCKEFGLKKEFLSAEFYECPLVDFMNQKGLDCIANKVDKMLFTLNKQYEAHGSKDTPYAFIKSDKGTYGMGITTLNSGEEIYHMNRSLRKKMGVIKSGVKNSCVLIQEGIKTINTYQGAVAENMIYLVAGQVVDSILRVNKERSALENLNRQGTEFVSMSDVSSGDYNGKVVCYNLIARLASLAASLE